MLHYVYSLEIFIDCFLLRIHVLPSVQPSSGLVLSPVALSLHGEGFDVPELRPCFSAGMALGAAQE